MYGYLIIQEIRFLQIYFWQLYAILQKNIEFCNGTMHRKGPSK